MTSTAATLIQELVAEFGWDEVIDALVEETKTAPGEELGAVEVLLDAVMVALLAADKGGKELRQAILQ